MDGVVPFTMKGLRNKLDLGHLLVPEACERRAEAVVLLDKAVAFVKIEPLDFA